MKKLGTLYDLYMSVLKQKEEWKEIQFNELNSKKQIMENKCQEFTQNNSKLIKLLLQQQNMKN